MVNYTIDVLIIGFITVLMVELIKAPIKVVLEKKGLKDNEMASKIFTVVTMFLSYLSCFVGVVIYFLFYKHVNPFLDTDIVWYSVGAIGASQAVYGFLEAYGRDGILAILKNILFRQKEKSTMDISALSEEGLDTFATKVVEGINRCFDDAPITKEDIKVILQNLDQL